MARIVTGKNHDLDTHISESTQRLGQKTFNHQHGSVGMKILGIELAVPPLERTIRGARWLISTIFVLAILTAVIGGDMHDVPKSGLHWLPMVALWTWGWDPLKQGPPAWILGVLAWIGSTALTALVIHIFVG
ncbi:membrane protein [Pseudomonas veronii 1YdBTEX2]|uniref:Membrane protein n=1 Tax=Pseudomonas veronii 1YdBTEX2 TaxID=1295141 RepID=A0A1D3K822_PSEVE|nr:membrane protein [Pseudomonas veronii 1YdBTEX2]